MHPIQLVRGDVELIPAGIDQVQVIPGGAFHRQGHHPHKAADAVELMDHQVPHVQFGKGQLGAFAPGLFRRAGHVPVKLPLADHRKPQLAVGKAPLQALAQDDLLPLDKGPVQALHAGQLHIQIRQPLPQPLPVGAGVDGHGFPAPAPGGKVLLQEGFIPHIPGDGPGLKAEGGLHTNEAIAAGQGEEQGGPGGIQGFDGLQGRAQHFPLLGLGLSRLDGGGALVQILAEEDLAALLQPGGFIQQKDPVLHIVQQGIGLGIEQGHEPEGPLRGTAGL